MTFPAFAHHLYYLHAPKSLGSAELRPRNARIGHATSTDLKTWTNPGEVLVAGAPGDFDETSIWTGSVAQDDDELWRMFYTGARFLVSGESTNVQSIGVATSPCRKYREFARLQAQGENTFDHLLYVALHQYGRLPKGHPPKHGVVIGNELTAPPGLDPAKTYVPDESSSKVHRLFRDYEQALAAIGGVDIQIFGIRTDCHIGFSKPTSLLSSRIRVQSPSEQTLKNNARFFPKGDRVPTPCITKGRGTIAEVKDRCSGDIGKIEASCSRCNNAGPMTNICPTSLSHTPPSVTILWEKDTASQPRLPDNYRSVANAKPLLAAEVL